LVIAATVHGRRGHPCRAQVQFRFQGGEPLKDYNGQFADGNGRVTARGDFTPLYQDSAVQDIRIFVPQRELHLTPGQTHHLEMLVSLVDTTSQPPEVLATAEPVPFDVTEPSEAATVYRFTVEHNVVRNLVRGIVVHTRFNVMGLKGGNCQLAVYLQRADGRPLVDRNGRYRAGDGSVAIFRDFAPQFPSADFADVPLFMPYDELDLPDPGEYALRARAVVWDRTTRRALDASPWAYFSVTRK
ncbi:MAG: hypothetical protein HYU66_02060, partial [Armatimonadetes bacterium]|nr:hypothetical protein [Armatimonadota bacterium]